MNNIDYKKEFIEEIGLAITEKSIDKYIEFVLLSANKLFEGYRENHHLLPNSLFKGKSYFNSDNNVFSLSYEDHVMAHILLAESYPISKFLRPLNFMLSREEKENNRYNEKLSIARKKDWVEFKKTDKYNVWKLNRSRICREEMINGKAKYMSDLFLSNQDYKEIRSKQFKDLWADDEYKERVIISMIEERNTPAGKDRMVLSAKKMWDDKSIEERISFNKKMSDINNGKEKRKDAGCKIKDKWKEEEFRNKMRIRDENNSKRVWIYNPYTHETKFINKDEKIYDGWLYGRDKSVLNTDNMKNRKKKETTVMGKKLYYNKQLDKKSYFFPNEVTIGWEITGRKYQEPYKIHHKNESN